MPRFLKTQKKTTPIKSDHQKPYTGKTLPPVGYMQFQKKDTLTHQPIQEEVLIDNGKVDEIIKFVQTDQPKKKIEDIAHRYAEKFGGKTSGVSFKEKDRILTKVKNEYGGDLTKLMDPIRTTVVLDLDEKEITVHNGQKEVNRNALLSEKLKNLVNTLKNDKEIHRVKIQNDEGYYGYKGIIANIKFEKVDNIFGEIQFNTPEMIYAKSKESSALKFISKTRYDAIREEKGKEGGIGHSLYEKIRNIPVVGATAAQINERDDLIKASQNYYKEFSNPFYEDTLYKNTL